MTLLRGKDLRAWRVHTAMIFQQFNLVNRLDVLTDVLHGHLNAISAARALFARLTVLVSLTSP